MSERYWITGVQLGLLQEQDKEHRSILVEQIIDEQFIGDKEMLDKLLKIKVR